jgi:uncharacterized membrane protein YeiB
MDAIVRLDQQVVWMLKFIGWFMILFGVGFSILIIAGMIRDRINRR